MTVGLDTANSLPGRKPERLPLLLSLSFGVGTVGVSCLLNTVAIYLPAMLATVFGVSPAIGGYLLTGSKLYDVGADLAIGAASDRTRSRMGRRRPYLLAGALISALAFGLIFNPPFAGGAALVVFMAFALVLYSTGYSLFNIPYLAMPAEMIDDPAAKTTLLAYRTFFIAIGQVVSVSGAAAIVSAYGGNRTGFGLMGLVLGAIIMATCLASFFGTAKARTVARTETGAPVKALQHAKLTLENRPFVLLMIGKFCSLLALAATSSTQLLFFLNVLKIGYAGQVYYGVAQNIALALSMPVWVKLARRFGKRPTYLALIASQALLSLSWLIPGVNGDVAVLTLRGVLTGLAAGGSLLIGISMLPDTMEYDRQRTGQRREGVFSSVYAIVEKVSYAIGPTLIGIYLGMSHYIPTTRGRLVPQPHSAVLALYAGLALLPALLYAGQFVCLWFYDLDEKRLKAGALGG